MIAKNKQQFDKFDISKRQKHVFEAAVENVKLANDAMKLSQKWLFTLGTVEVVFLGSVFLSDGSRSYYLSLLVAILLVAFLFFIIGSVIQYKHLLDTARLYENISNKAIEKYLNKGVIYVDNIPTDLELPDKQIISNKWANIFFRLAFDFIFISTIGIVILIFVPQLI